jgi:hypothetical protein
VLTFSRLEELLGEDQDWVVVRPGGEPVEMTIPPDIGPATLLVSPVTDALKTVSDGRVVGSLHRDSLWAVEAFALNRVVISRLKEEEEMSPYDLHEAVSNMAFGWQIALMPQLPASR